MSAQKIWVAGHRGMVGSAVARQLGKRGDDVLKTDRAEVDLRNQAAVETWLQRNAPRGRRDRGRQGRRDLCQ